MTNISKTLIGWQEWCGLPDFNIPYIKVKVDTGAKTSSLHAFNIKEFTKNHQSYVSFEIHPLQNNDKIKVTVNAKVVDQRYVMSSNGHKELRYVIRANLILAGETFQIFLTLSNRDPLRFRMLLGRDALANNCIIDPAKKYCLGKHSRIEIKKFYLNKLI